MLSRLLTIAALLAALPAAAEPPALSLVTTGPDGLGPAYVAVRGEAADGCAPEPVALARRDREIVLRARRPAQCLAGPTPFAFDSRGLGAPLLIDAPGLYRLRLEVQGPSGAPTLAAFELAEAGPPAAAVVPETGFWWGEAGGEFDRALPGFGVQIEAQSGTIALAVSGYADDGRPEWLFGAAPVSGHRLQLPLGRLQGGGGPFGRFRAPAEVESAGRLDVEFLDGARAVLWFQRPAVDGDGIELRPVSIVRFAFAEQVADWRGRWLLAATSADGDPALAPQALDFSGATTTATGFELTGDDGARLVCTLDPARPASPPSQCRLEQSGDRVTEFDDIGLARMRGDGGRVVLVRIGG